MQYDSATIERLVEQITQQVLIALGERGDQGSITAKSGHDPNCPDCERQGVQRPSLRIVHAASVADREAGGKVADRATPVTHGPRLRNSPTWTVVPRVPAGRTTTRGVA